MTSLQSLIKQYNDKTRTPITPIRLSFGKDGGKEQEKVIDNNMEELKHLMPTNMKIYDGSTDPDDHINRFVRAANQGEWFLALGWHFEEIHMTWAHLDKKQTRLRTYTKSMKKYCLQSVETASQA
ncbi:hypothetical protein Tco_1352454 [Tanacetum coccineum]